MCDKLRGRVVSSGIRRPPAANPSPASIYVDAPATSNRAGASISTSANTRSQSSTIDSLPTSSASRRRACDSQVLEGRERARCTEQTSIQWAVASLRRQAARAGHAPHHDLTHTVPDACIVKGVSTYYSMDGLASGHWVKAQVDAK